MLCESGGDPQAVSPAGHRGLYQIGYVHIERITRLGYTWDDMLLAGPNLAVAYDLASETQRGGLGWWHHWRFSGACHGY